MGGKCSGLGTINVAGGLGTIKNETQLNVDSRKVRGCLISPGVGGTVQQWHNVRRLNTSGAVALVLSGGVTFEITLLYNNRHFNTRCDISESTSNDWPWSRGRNGEIYIHLSETSISRRLQSIILDAHMIPRSHLPTVGGKQPLSIARRIINVRKVSVYWLCLVLSEIWTSWEIFGRLSNRKLNKIRRVRAKFTRDDDRQTDMTQKIVAFATFFF